MTNYANEWMGGGWDKPDKGEVSGLTHDPTDGSKRARRRAEYGARVNTNANRKNGGGATWGRVSAEYLAGTQRVNPVTESTVKTRDDHGMTLPAQHLTATRKRHERDGTAPKSGKLRKTGRKADAPFTRFESEDEYLRTRVRTDAERRSLLEYR
jgi:hypothetical protein